MRRIMAYLMMLLPVALLAAHAGNNPFVRSNFHMGPETALSRVAHHQQAHHAYRDGLARIAADLPYDDSQRSMKGTAQQNAATNAVGLPSTSSPLVQVPMTRASLIAEEEDEEEDADDEGDDEDKGEGEGEEEEGEGGWDRVWDAPKLG